MKTSREDILRAALTLFAARGYDGVSTGMIAERLGITKGALYRHFDSKQDIFDGLWQRMIELDGERAREDAVPEKTSAEAPEDYRQTTPEALYAFVVGQFDFWTGDAFARDFRRMMSLEQFRSPEMTKRYQDLIGAGPVRYTADLMAELLQSGRLNRQAADMGPDNLALMLFAPLALCIRLFDGGGDPDVLRRQLGQITADFAGRWAP